ncbi:MAG: hypothetical protein DMF69_06760 [Acidobacteria bacterium]|nr:MAG: hypothetical protein DMF69_06760 [Acidobacteriota bacterium]
MIAGARTAGIIQMSEINPICACLVVTLLAAEMALTKVNDKTGAYRTLKLAAGETMSTDEVLANQKTIISNQETIQANQEKLNEMLSNQQTIISNQQSILANQEKLDNVVANQESILANQKEILSRLNK